MIRGTGFRFVDGKYFRTGSREEIAGDMQLVAVGMITAWQKWVDQELADIRVTPDGGYHPSREALPDDDPALWPIGKDGKPSRSVGRRQVCVLRAPCDSGRVHVLHIDMGRPHRGLAAKARTQTIRRMRAGNAISLGRDLDDEIPF